MGQYGYVPTSPRHVFAPNPDGTLLYSVHANYLAHAWLVFAKQPRYHEDITVPR